MTEVRAAHATLAAIPDVELLEEQQEAEWGGGFSWRDPEGNVWDVAFKHGSDFDHRGGFIYP